MSEPTQASGDLTVVTACTIVARNYLPAARVLAASYLKHHPGHQFVVGVIDSDRVSDGGAEAETVVDGMRIVGPSAFGIDPETYLRMATAYSVTELATAVKPYLLRSLRSSSSVVIYLDPDIQVFAPMPEVAELALEHSIVLTPHFTAPLPRDGKEPDDAVIMGTGIFNLGFVGVGPGSEEFLEFWAGRLRQDAIVAPEEQLFTDQRWVDQVPALFRHVVLTDPGFNVAYWNLHERPVDRDETGAITAGGRPVRFFHFSGYRPEKPWLLTFHCARNPRVLLSDNPELRELCDAYGAALKASGYAETLDAVPYGFATFGDGTPLPSGCRRLFRDGWIAAENPDSSGRTEPMPPHAYGEDGGEALRAWLSAPADHAQAAAGLNRLAMSVWRTRTDLQLAFPHPTGSDADGFREWCRTSGVSEKVLPEWALPEQRPQPSEPSEDFGVNLLGYLTAELGLGEMGRVIHDAMVAADIEVASVVEERAVSNRTGVERPETAGDPRFPVSVIAVNADQTRLAVSTHPDVMHDRYRIGLWAWELEDFPEWQHEAFGMVDEVWTVSDFCRDAFAAHSPVPVKTIPVPVRDPGYTARTRKAGDPTRFLFAFDFNSVGQRKNPWGAVEAFRLAFDGRTDVRLVLKTINGHLHPQAAERLRTMVADDARIELIEGYLSAAELAELYATADCYVSLHRSEGFGLTVAEAMARGMPVISTAYSSTTEFLDANTGWPIPYRLVPVGEGCEPYHPDALWAEPDVDAAADAMRQIADVPAEAARRGRAAREHILRTRSMDAASTWLRTELERAHRTWLERRRAAQDAGPPPEHPLTPMRTAREALRWRPEPGAASRTPIAPALRKAVLRLLDHYDVHQRKVLGALHEGSETTMQRLLERIESLERAVEENARAAAQAEQVARRQDTRAEALRKSVDELRRAGGVSAEEFRSNKADVRKIADRVAKLSSDVERGQETVHDLIQARDQRFDNDEHAIQRLGRDLEAVLEAARLVHAPIPESGDVVVCDAGVLLLPSDDVMLPWIRHHRSWERDEAQLMTQLAARRPGAFLDVGAHVGYHTLSLLRSSSTVTNVVAVEADPTNAEFLRRNLAVNLPKDRSGLVSVLEAAAWDTDGNLVLAHPDERNSGDHRVREPDGMAGLMVPAVRLDGNTDVLRQPVSLVKTDLQGRDHRALAGLQETLERDRPDVLCEFSPEAIEEFGDDPHAVLTAYRKWGYQPVELAPDGTLAEDEPDESLIHHARTDQRGFTTLWLRPQ
ncbi:FkbM family methyltransferase [Prauserella rugosa]|uniref:FkbM family methyltransferase n=1 Tax=Prauserella rugosa TaxID=43354 RepID=A0A660CE25_9PSEU|nr:FkbM family methyltransferase [Prauserella rugosa]TWH21800.1 FkbM family methyltransferase [Prauserella rugosa]